MQGGYRDVKGRRERKLEGFEALPYENPDIRLRIGMVDAVKQPE
jgi:hypothetical protein